MSAMNDYRDNQRCVNISFGPFFQSIYIIKAIELWKKILRDSKRIHIIFFHRYVFYLDNFINNFKKSKYIYNYYNLCSYDKLLLAS